MTIYEKALQHAEEIRRIREQRLTSSRERELSIEEKMQVLKC